MLRHKSVSSHRYRLQPGRRKRYSDLFALNLFVFAFMALALLVLGRIESPKITLLRNLMTQMLAPVMETAAVPAGYLNRTLNRLTRFSTLLAETERLKKENAQLKQYKWQAEKLELELADLRKLKEAPGLSGIPHYLTARLILDERSRFSKSFLINLGTLHGIRDGMAVVNAEGVMGRTIQTGKKISRVLLLTDPLSHIPVFVGEDRGRAILSGNREKPPLLSYRAADKTIQAGDIVYTSGEGNVFPHGMRIGKIMKTDLSAGKPVMVALDVKTIRSDFVRIILKKPYQGINQHVLQKRPLSKRLVSVPAKVAVRPLAQN